jgi:hypothetical protein
MGKVARKIFLFFQRHSHANQAYFPTSLNDLLRWGSAMHKPNDSEYLTRRALVEYLRANGYPISLHSLNRLCAPRCGQGPTMAGVWGGKAFYTPYRALKWARARFGANELRRTRRETRD